MTQLVRITPTALLVALLAAPAAGQVFSGRLPGPQLIGPGSTIGVTVADIGPDAPAGADAGARVQQVQPDSPAARAGFAAGDVVISFDGERVRSVRQFVRLVQETPPTREVETIVLRKGERVTLRVTPELGRAGVTEGADVQPPVLQLPLLRARPAVPAPGGAPDTPRLGVAAMAIDDQLAEHFGVDQGVLVTSVDAGSPAAAAGLRAGDVLLQVGAQRVRTPNDVTSALAALSAGASVELQVMRDRKRVTLKATLPPADRPSTPPQRFRL